MCGGLLTFDKEWKLKGKGNHATFIELWKCADCGASVRTQRKGENEPRI